MNNGSDSSLFPSSMDPFNTSSIPPVLPFSNYGNSTNGFYSQQQMFQQDPSPPLNGLPANNLSTMASFMGKHVPNTNGGGLTAGVQQPYYDFYFPPQPFNELYYNS